MIALGLGMACANPPAAAVIPIANGHVLLAWDPAPGRGWGTFGGGADRGETPVETALRELREETRCNLEIPGSSQPRQVEPRPKDLVHTFVLTVEMTDPTTLAGPVGPGCSGGTEERGAYAWVPLEALDLGDRKGRCELPAAFLDPAHPPTCWEASYAFLRRARAQGLL